MKTGSPHINSELIRRVGDMPALAPLVIELLKVSNEPDASFVTIAELANSDPVLATRLLKVANSAYFGLPGRVETLSVAVAVIGLKMLRRLLLSMTTRQIMDIHLPSYGMARGGLWTHSLAVAKTSSWLCQLLSYRQEEELWAAGLFHDLGKVIVSDLMEGLVSPQAARSLGRGGAPCVELETEICGYGHPEVSALVGEKWNLSERFVAVTRFHHAPEKATGFHKSVAILNAADSIASHMLANGGRIDEGFELSEFTVDVLGLDVERIAEGAAELSDGMFDDVCFLIDCAEEALDGGPVVADGGPRDTGGRQ
jgi:putative nucleotidyltransferase with HDIG domain